MGRALMFQPEVGTRDPAAQRAGDDAAQRRQLRYLFDRSPFHAEKLRAAGFADAAACGSIEDLPRLPSAASRVGARRRATSREAPAP